MKPRNRIYLDEKITSGKHIKITEKLAHYLIKVLRCKIHEKILVFNQSEWLAEIVEVRSKTLRLNVLNKIKDAETSKSIKIYFSPLKKNTNELLIQKCTEIGINIFQPVVMEHTNISKVNIDRLRLIAIEAIEQSGQITIPKIYQSINFNDFIKQIDSNEVVIACTVQNNNMFMDQIIKENHAKNISILIGPEGDFSKLELEKIFEHNNIVEATLGKNILKGETAAIVASALAKENIKVC